MQGWSALDCLYFVVNGKIGFGIAVETSMMNEKSLHCILRREKLNYIVNGRFAHRFANDN